MAQFAAKALDKEPTAIDIIGLGANLKTYVETQNVNDWSWISHYLDRLASTDEKKKVLPKRYGEAIMECFGRAAKNQAEDTLVLIKATGTVYDEDKAGYGGIGKTGQKPLKAHDCWNRIYKVDHDIEATALQQLMLGALVHMAADKLK